MLVSHHDRDVTIAKLQNAFLVGKLQESELEERVMRALEASSKSDLATLLTDVAPDQLIASSPKNRAAVAVFSGVERRGDISIPERFSAVAIFGGCHLDLSSAVFSSPVTKFTAVAVFGGIEIIVPEGVRVYLNQVPILAGISSKVPASFLPANAPSIHVKAVAVCGGVEIRRA